MPKNYECDNCGSKKSKEFIEYRDGSILCYKCEHKIGSMWEKNANKSNFLKYYTLTIILIFLILAIAHIILNMDFDKKDFNNEIKNIVKENEVININREDDYIIKSKLLDNVEIVKKILEDYHKTHTYSLTDFFVCSDMAIDVWNLVKTKGINAQICAGNPDMTIYGSNQWESILLNMNHAWVIAETNPFKWLALETTGGHVVYGEENDLYYEGICFENPKKFKEFINLRQDYFKACYTAKNMANHWNEEIAGNIFSNMDDVYKFEGQIEIKEEECKDVLDQLNVLVS